MNYFDAQTNETPQAKWQCRRADVGIVTKKVYLDRLYEEGQSMITKRLLKYFWHLPFCPFWQSGTQGCDTKWTFVSFRTQGRVGKSSKSSPPFIPDTPSKNTPKMASKFLLSIWFLIVLQKYPPSLPPLWDRPFGRLFFVCDFRPVGPSIPITIWEIKKSFTWLLSFLILSLSFAKRVGRKNPLVNRHCIMTLNNNADFCLKKGGCRLNKRLLGFE